MDRAYMLSLCFQRCFSQSTWPDNPSCCLKPSTASGKQLIHQMDQMTNIPSSSSAFTAQPSSSAASSAPHLAPPTWVKTSPKEPFLPTPECFAGDLSSSVQFLLQWTVLFNQQPSTYASDKSTISFVTRLLAVNAAEWATAFLERSSPTCNSFSLNEKFQKWRDFEHPIQGKEATSQLLTLCQCSQSVATFEFRILAAESGWNKISLLGVIIHGLSEEIKDKLATRDEMDSLGNLISLFICPDKLLRERRWSSRFCSS